MSADEKNQSEKRWLARQRKLSEESGLAISIVDNDGLSSLAESNNNSVCTVLSNAEGFEPECAKYCGRVYSQSKKSLRAFKYKCHAGLECIAVPIDIKGRKKAVAIVGRAFTKAEDYKEATEKAISGSWNDFAPSSVFENILLAGSQSVEMLAKKFADLDPDDIDRLRSFLDPIEKSSQPQPEVLTKAPSKIKAKNDRDGVSEKRDKGDKKEIDSSDDRAAAPTLPQAAKQKKRDKNLESPVIRLPKINEFGTAKDQEDARVEDDQPLLSVSAGQSGDEITTLEELAEQASWRSLFGDILDLKYVKACKLILKFLNDHYQIKSMAWLENHNNRLSTTLATGKLKSQKIQISVAMDDPRMRKLLREESSIELRERAPESGDASPDSIRLFPVIVGDDIKSALVIGDRAGEQKVIDSISRFCKTVTSELEILRLREELSRRTWLDIAFRKFNESLKMIDNDDFWMRLIQNTAELLQAERGSLLIHDEKSGKLVVKAAIGRKADVLRSDIDDLGLRIANGVWERGEALVIRNISKSSIKPAPAEWNYRTGSFISYPLVIGDRKIGVLNIADKVDGGEYGEEEVQLLHNVVPHIAVAADRANLKSKAGEYEQLSVTDPLTGLLNRRYLEERLDEEIKRSARHGFPMSFMMIDVDDFKSYNDQFLHPEGDKALKIVGQCLRETLRGADVAARYGGEEFSILLPQTTLEEAKTIAERIRANIETAEIPHRQVTVSIGIATLAGSIDNVEKLIKCADKALFKAKRAGKNQVIVFKGNNSGQPVTVH